MEWRSLCYLHLLEPLNRYYDTCRHLKKIAEDSSADYSQYFKWSYLWDLDTEKKEAVQEIAGDFREVYDTCMHLRKLSTKEYEGRDVRIFGKSHVCRLGETEIEKIGAAVKDKKIEFFQPPDFQPLEIDEFPQDYCQKAGKLNGKISELLPDFSKSLEADMSALHAGLPYYDYIKGYLTELNEKFRWNIRASDLSEFVFLAVYKFIFGPNPKPEDFNEKLKKNEDYKYIFNDVAELYEKLRNKQVKELENDLKDASKKISKLHKEDIVFEEFQSKLLEYSLVQPDKWNSEYSPKENNSMGQMSLSFNDKSVYVGEYGDLTYKYGNFEIILSPKVFFNFLENKSNDLLKNFKEVYTNKCKKIELKEILRKYEKTCKKGEVEEIEKMEEAMKEVEVGSLLKFELPNSKKSKQNEGVYNRLGDKIKIFRAKTPKDSYTQIIVDQADLERFCADVAVCIYPKAKIEVVYNSRGKQDISEEDKSALKMNNLLHTGLRQWGNFRIVSLLVGDSEEYYIQRLPKPSKK